MERASLAPKWSPQGLLQRLRRLLRQPGDVVLALQIGWFIWRAPGSLETAHLADLLARLRRAKRPRAEDLSTGVVRLVRLASAWLRLPPLRSHQTCYLRALLLFRFLDPGTRSMRFHLGVEPGRDRLHGHAWVTVDGQPLGLEDETIPARSRLLYSYPD